MKIYFDEHSSNLTVSFTEDFFFEFSSEWGQLFGKYNWYSFTPIEIRFEAGHLGGAEIQITFLGFGMFGRWNYDRKPLNAIKEEIKEAQEEYTKKDHFHCWQSLTPPCGQKIEHLKCCLCEEINPKCLDYDGVC